MRYAGGASTAKVFYLTQKSRKVVMFDVEIPECKNPEEFERKLRETVCGLGRSVEIPFDLVKRLDEEEIDRLLMDLERLCRTKEGPFLMEPHPLSEERKVLYKEADTDIEYLVFAKNDQKIALVNPDEKVPYIVDEKDLARYFSTLKIQNAELCNRYPNGVKIELGDR